MQHETFDRETGVTPLDQVREMDGYEFLRRIASGELKAPPINRPMNFYLHSVEKGRAVFHGTPLFDHYNPIGSVHGGWIATLLDSCMSCAVQTMLEKGLGYTTLEMKVNMIRAVTDQTGPMRAIGDVINVGRRIGVAEGRLVDANGRVHASGSATCLIMPLGPD